MAEKGPKWPKMARMSEKWHPNPSPLDFCLSCDRFEWSFDQFTTILSLGPKWPKIILMKSFTFAPFVFVFPPGLIEFRCWSSYVLEKYIVNSVLVENIWERNVSGDFSVGSVSRQFQQEIVSRNLLQWADINFVQLLHEKKPKLRPLTKYLSETHHAILKPRLVVTIASRSIQSSKLQVMQVTPNVPPFAPKCFPEHVFVDGGNNIKWTCEKIWIHKCVNAQGCWKRKQVTLRD